MFIKFSLLVFLLGLGSGCGGHNDSSELSAGGLANNFTANRTEEYNALSSHFRSGNVKFSKAEIEKLRSFKVLIAPGTFIHMLKDGKTDSFNPKGGYYFGAFKAVLKLNKINYKLLRWKEQRVPAENGDLIRKEIRQTDKPVLLVGHSQGGQDILEALAFLTDREISSGKVAGFISIQTPFYGEFWSEAARPDTTRSTWSELGFISNSWFAKSLRFALLSKTLRSMRTDPLIVEHTSFHYRDKYMNSRWIRAQVAKIKKSIPTFNVRTYYTKTPAKNDPFKWTHSEIPEKNDGLVNYSSASIVGFDYVDIPDVSHVASVMDWPNSTFNRTNMAVTLLKMSASNVYRN